MKKCTFLLSAAGMLVLILDGQTAMAGMAEGIELCIKTLIPSLFPFFVLSILLTGALVGHPVKLLQPLGKLCRIPNGAESLLAVGLLGGYPVGAQNVSLAYQTGQLSQSDARRLIAFCNNAGPAFIFGVLGSLFSDSRAVWLLWLIHMISALLVGIILPGGKSQVSVVQRNQSISLPEAMEKAIKVMAQVCGWVVLFRMVLTFLNRWFLWMLPASAQVGIAGILELSNGCIMLGQLENEGLRFVLASTLLAFGGICVTMQTASVTAALSLKLYFPGKLLQTCFSFLLATLVQHQYTVMPAAIAVAILMTTCLITILRYPQKRGSNPALIGV